MSHLDLERESRKEGYVFWSAIGFVFALIVFGSFGSLLLQIVSPESTVAATSSAVTVNATVATAISCSVSTTTTSFGTLTSAALTTSTPNVSSTMACANSYLGCTLSLNDVGSSTAGGGLYSSAVNELIASPNAAFNATATLTIGTKGYGVQAATTSAGSGALFGINSRYLQIGTVFGGLTTSTLTLASTSATSSAREVVATHGADIAASTPGGTYTDTITYSCTAN